MFNITSSTCPFSNDFLDIWVLNYNHWVERSSEGQSSATVRSSSKRVLNSTGDVNQKRAGRMVLPFEPHSITFDEIRYAVDMPQVSWKDYKIEFWKND